MDECADDVRFLGVLHVLDLRLEFFSYGLYFMELIEDMFVVQMLRNLIDLFSYMKFLR